MVDGVYSERVSKVVGSLAARELKVLATLGLESFRSDLVDTLSGIAIKRMSYGDQDLFEKDSAETLGRYQIIRENMQHYGLWDSKYDRAFEEARTSGRLMEDILSS
ncbi:MAG: hypothetical protein WCK90_04925 [archaeon]